LGALLALLAAISYGIGDFLGGLGGRRAHAALIPIPVQVVGVLTATVAILTGLGGAPTTSALLWGGVSGIESGVGNAMLIRGLAAGRMSVVAPLSAVMTAAVPALVGIVAAAAGSDSRVGRVGKPTFPVRKRSRPIDCRRSAGLTLSRIHRGVGCRGPA
jgi:uncharacterized membrane protein